MYCEICMILCVALGCKPCTSNVSILETLERKEGEEKITVLFPKKLGKSFLWCL